MSDSTLTERASILRSPYNGEAWTVPPDVNDVMYQALLRAGFTPIQPPKPKKPKDERDRG